MLRDESGASAVEYGLIIAAVAAILVVVIFAVGAFTGEMFADTCASIESVSTLSSAADC